MFWITLTNNSQRIILTLVFVIDGVFNSTAHATSHICQPKYRHRTVLYQQCCRCSVCVWVCVLMFAVRTMKFKLTAKYTNTSVRDYSSFNFRTTDDRGLLEIVREFVSPNDFHAAAYHGVRRTAKRTLNTSSLWGVTWSFFEIRDGTAFDRQRWWIIRERIDITFERIESASTPAHVTSWRVLASAWRRVRGDRVWHSPALKHVA